MVSNFCGMLFTLQDLPSPFITRKLIVTKLNFEINRTESYIVLMGKRPFLLLFM